MSSFRFARGVYVTDRITGFAGCIVGRSDHLTGCNRYCVQPSVDTKGRYLEPQWLDEHSLEVDRERQQLRLDRADDDPPG